MNSSYFTLFFVHLFCLALFTLHFGDCKEIACIPSEREALLKFKHHLKDPSNRLSSWNVTANSNCCQWAGVVCNNVTAHVVQLHLNTSPPNFDGYVLGAYLLDGEDYDEAYRKSQFGGEIHPCLVDLTHLSYLDLSGNLFFEGGMPIPSFFMIMTSLTYLNLSSAGFSGRIPSQIGNLSNLIYLDLSYAANGPIPYEIGNLSNLLYLDLTSDLHEPMFAENVDWLSTMSKLEYLDLGGANLSKSFHWLQTLQALPSLTNLGLSRCTLPHHNQPSLLNFSSLLTLDLSLISYSSAVISFVPKWVFGLKKLVSLILRDNYFEGPIPDGIRNLTLLENLDLQYNSFSSSIPDWLYELHHVKYLNLKVNKLHGTISDALGNLTSLVELDLSHNHLEGAIPTSLANLCYLREINFSFLKLNQQANDIVEILAPCISHVLASLRVRSSQLSGILTDQFGIFKKITELDLSGNSNTWSIS